MSNVIKAEDKFGTQLDDEVSMLFATSGMAIALGQVLNGLKKEHLRKEEVEKMKDVIKEALSVYEWHHENNSPQ